MVFIPGYVSNWVSLLACARALTPSPSPLAEKRSGRGEALRRYFHNKLPAKTPYGELLWGELRIDKVSLGNNDEELPLSRSVFQRGERGKG